jgi:hypothetical protein
MYTFLCARSGTIATFFIRCTVPKGFDAIVGPGQTAECKDGEIHGREGIVQLNGNCCDSILKGSSLVNGVGRISLTLRSLHA